MYERLGSEPPLKYSQDQVHWWNQDLFWHSEPILRVNDMQF